MLQGVVYGLKYHIEAKRVGAMAIAPSGALTAPLGLKAVIARIM